MTNVAVRYRFMACVLAATFLVVQVILGILKTKSGEVYIGPLTDTANGVTGVISIPDMRTIRITNFSFDGQVSDVFFTGIRRVVDDDEIPEGVTFEYGSSLENKTCDLIPAMKSSEILVFIPFYLKVSDFTLLSVHDYQSCTSLGAVDIPENVEVNTPPERLVMVEECTTLWPACSEDTRRELQEGTGHMDVALRRMIEQRGTTSPHFRHEVVPPTMKVPSKHVRKSRFVWTKPMYYQFEVFTTETSKVGYMPKPTPRPWWHWKK